MPRFHRREHLRHADRVRLLQSAAVDLRDQPPNLGHLSPFRFLHLDAAADVLLLLLLLLQVNKCKKFFSVGFWAATLKGS